MAAKLKKRAAAEYQSQTIALDEGETSSSSQLLSEEPRKRLKLVLQRSTGSTSSRTADQDVLPIDKITNSREISGLLVQLLPKIKSMEREEVVEAATKIIAATGRDLEDSVKVQLFLALGFILSSSDPVSAEVRPLVRDHVEEWLQSLAKEKANKTISAVLGLIAKLHEYHIPLNCKSYTKVFEVIQEHLKSNDISVRINALRVIGGCLVHSGVARMNTKILSICGKFTHSPEPRIRSTAFESLLSIHKNGHRLNIGMYSSVCQALDDDYDGARQAALRLVHILGQTYPDERVKVASSSSSSRGHRNVRLVDDAFGKICNAINDLAVQVRELAAELIGTMTNVSQEFLEQTLDKKLMSNMRMKKSAHQRESKLVQSGEWSSGKKWADDAPKEELDAETVNLMSFGACGAFIHGLEDEFLAVRSAAVESLTKLSTKNSKLAALALDFLVDMFNDEIELVRLKAIESLRVIAGHISLQVHQLETILSALEDYSIVVREKLHIMLQASTIGTKDGLQNVVNKLLDNLKKYPQDKRSILLTFKRLGENHSELTLPLVTQLLEIHPFFDTAEPDVDEPAYLCILVLVFNAAQHCPTMEPLLDQHTKKHYHYLLDTYPLLMPSNSLSSETQNSTVKTNTNRFLKQTLQRVHDSEHLSMVNRIKLLERAIQDLKCLGSIEPGMRDATNFAHLYLQCQTLILKSLSTRFWTNPHALASQQTEIIETNIATVGNLTLQLKHKFSNLSPALKRRIQILKIHLHSLHLLFLVRASNKSALNAADLLLSEIELINLESSDEEIAASPFLSDLIKKLSEAVDHKPGTIVRIIQPLLLAHPLESLPSNDDSSSSITMCHAVIYDPLGMNETPLKYTAGMILAVPVDCEVFNVANPKMVRIAIKTPDQKIQLVTPKQSQFFEKEENCYRLLTEALMSHQVWSEALHVEIRLVLDLSSGELESGSSKRRMGASAKDGDKSLINICEPVKVYVLPKAVKRGI